MPFSFFILNFNLYFLQLKTVDHDSGTESDDEHSPEREPKSTKQNVPESTRCKCYNYRILS